VTELGVDELLGRLQQLTRERWPSAEIRGLSPLHGGISSLTFSAGLTGTGDGGERAVVVKVAPPGLAPVRNRDVLRQARVMKAVHSAAGVRVPEVLLEDDGSPPLFVMDFVAGEAYEPKWDVAAAPPAPEVVDQRARAAARMLARLQAVEPAAVGLAAEPALSLAQELERWSRLFATAGDDLRGDELTLQRALAARTPTPVPAGGQRILHGDYRLGNMQFAGERLAAIIDWEIWSVGDPRTDLAWLLAFADPVQQRVAQRDGANQAAADAMPSRDELLEEYRQTAARTEPATGAHVATEIESEDLDWFLALCYYKLGATMAVLAKRNRRLAEPDPGLELAAVTTPAMLAGALELLKCRDSRP
jgi:aminoglycoside phosphotransferase (APT) family kinase protein